VASDCGSPLFHEVERDVEIEVRANRLSGEGICHRSLHLAQVVRESYDR